MDIEFFKEHKLETIGVSSLIIITIIVGFFMAGGPSLISGREQTPTPQPLLANLPTSTPTAPPATPIPPSATPLPIPTVPLPPLPPEVPAESQVYVVTPQAGAAGWVRQDDVIANHFNDYNLYVGVFENQIQIGGIQFDLSAIPQGAPILYADLTLVGLSNDWLGNDGVWTMQLLEWWIDQEWSQIDFTNLSRDDSVADSLFFNLFCR